MEEKRASLLTLLALSRELARDLGETLVEELVTAGLEEAGRRTAEPHPTARRAVELH